MSTLFIQPKFGVWGAFATRIPPPFIFVGGALFCGPIGWISRLVHKQRRARQVKMSGSALVRLFSMTKCLVAAWCLVAWRGDRGGVVSSLAPLKRWSCVQGGR